MSTSTQSENKNRAISNETLIKQLNWRYATKVFDPTKKISEEDWKTLEQALVLSPSSFGLQPWKFFVVTDQKIKESLVEHSWKQTQPRDASHVVVFAIKHDLGAVEIDKFLKRTTEVTGRPADQLEGYKNIMLGFMKGLGSPEARDTWATNQIYISLGQFMASAAVLGIDVCPMEGIVRDKYDEILGIKAKGYRTVVVAPAGYRSSEDKYATTPKVRFETNDVVDYI